MSAGGPLSAKPLRRSLRIGPKLVIRLNSRNDLCCSGRSVASGSQTHVIDLNINEEGHDVFFARPPAELACAVKEVAVILVGERLAVCVLPRLSIRQEANRVPVGPADIPEARQLDLRRRC